MTQVPGGAERPLSHILSMPSTGNVVRVLFAPRTEEDLWTPGAPRLNIVNSLGDLVVASVETEYPLGTTTLRTTLRAACLTVEGALQVDSHVDSPQHECGPQCFSYSIGVDGTLEYTYKGAAMPHIEDDRRETDTYTASHLRRLKEATSSSDLFVPDGYNFSPWVSLFEGHRLGKGLHTAIESEGQRRVPKTT